MMKVKQILALGLLFCLTACQTPVGPEPATTEATTEAATASVTEPPTEAATEPASSSSAASSEEDASVSAVGEDTPSSSPNPDFIPDKPTPDQISDPAYWLNNYLPLTVHGFQPDYQRSNGLSDSSAYNGPYLFISTWLAATGQLPVYLTTEGRAVMPLDDFFYYSKLFFGEASPDETLQSDSAFDGRIDWENRTIELVIFEHYNSARDSFDMRSFRWFMDYWKFTEITPYTEDGTEKVKIEIEDYESREFSELNRLETYVLYWNDEVGYIVESSSWRWPDTNQVSFEGDVALLDTLWGIVPDHHENMPMPIGSVEYLSSTMTVDTMHYRPRMDGSKLVTDSFDLTTGEQASGEFIYDFGDERVLELGYEKAIRHYHSDDGFVVCTNKAAYFFDDSFELVIRKNWPAAIESELQKQDLTFGFALNDDFSRVAYTLGQGNGVYLCAMEKDAAPILLQENIPFNTTIMGDYESPYPIRFLGRDSLFVGVGMWERTGKFHITDMQGNITTELPFAASGLIGGGNLVLNGTGAIISPMTEETDYYFSFENNALEPAGWLDDRIMSGANACVPDANNPYVWYVSNTYYEEGRTVFVKLDFESKAATLLPFAVIGSDATLLAVGEDGRMLFTYAYKNEKGFGVFSL
jgi:hypothetical protein